MGDPRHRVYLDWNATTPLHPKAREAMMPFLADPDLFGNPSSVHWYGRRVRKAVEEARAAVAKLVGARDPWEIVFTSGATESANQVIHG
ncbi:MAG: aminotransferase class V-fold PLP-dependent enzyme, partial [bacterium]